MITPKFLVIQINSQIHDFLWKHWKNDKEKYTFTIIFLNKWFFFLLVFLPSQKSPLSSHCFTCFDFWVYTSNSTLSSSDKTQLSASISHRVNANQPYVWNKDSLDSPINNKINRIIQSHEERGPHRSMRLLSRLSLNYFGSSRRSLQELILESSLLFLFRFLPLPLPISQSLSLSPPNFLI